MLKLLVVTALCVGMCSAAMPMHAATTRPCDVAEQASLPFCNQQLSYEERVKDLVSRLELSEKYTQFGNKAPGIPRLSIAPQQWWGEALHGVADSPSVNFHGQVKCATSFPQVIGTGATFNETLWHAIGNTISTEARAMSNVGQAGTTFWSPVINQARDPRWGRLQETPGEDPLHIATYAANFAQGLQSGEDEKHLKVSSCCKHFIAYSLEQWHGMDRYHFDAITTPRDLADSYMPPFEGCVRNGQASSVMCSYNSVNGVPSCANRDLLTGVVREAWGFEGYIVSDCDAVDNVQTTHHYTNNTADTCEVTLSAGMDVDCGDYMDRAIEGAVTSGVVKESLLDSALFNQFMVRFRLGEFDSVASQPYLKYGIDRIATQENQQLALDAARQSIVLLTNRNNVLPFTQPQSLAVIGPHLNATHVMQGSYYGHACSITTPYMGLLQNATRIESALGCKDVKCESDEGFAEAVSIVSASDAVIMFVGLDQDQESEGHDRDDLTLPGKQSDLVSAVVKAALGKPVIVVLLSGGPLDVSDLRDNTGVSAILWAGYPGQAGGQAIAEILFGQVNPGGRLPVTWYPQAFTTEASLFDMGMRPNISNGNPGRTYRFYTGVPIFPFGHGLSYTSFSYGLSVTESVMKHAHVSAVAAVSQQHFLRGHKNDEEISIVHVPVTNTGKVSGSDVVMLFATPPGPPGMGGNPLMQLVGFKRVFLQPGETVVVDFPLFASDFTLFSVDGTREAVAGKWTLSVGEERVHVSVE